MAMIVGNDISSYQGQVDWNTYKHNTNFLIVKSSEGVGYIDKWFGHNRTQARNHGIPLGYYHFCRPDLGNSPEAEADFFCRLLDGDPIREGEVIALDFEVNFSSPVVWCKKWLDFVSSRYNGMKPLIYLNQSQVRTYDWTPIVQGGYGLWLASYTYDPHNNSGFTGEWDFMAMQQWTSSQVVPGLQGRVDGNVFFGDVEAFKKYGYQKPQPPAPIPVPIPPPAPPTPEPVPPQPTPPEPVPPVIIPPPLPTPPPVPVPDPDQVLIQNLKSIIQAKWTWIGLKGWKTRLAQLRALVS